MKKFLPLKELFISFVIFLLFLGFFEYLSLNIETTVDKKIIVNISFFIFYLSIYVLPTIFLFFNYDKYTKKRKINYSKLSENQINKIILIATRDKIKDRPSVYSLPYHMNFFYLRIYLKNGQKPIFITSIDEYNIEDWARKQFPNIKIDKKIDYFPIIRD